MSDYVFFKRVRCLRACNYDRPYQPGDEREVTAHVTAKTELEARRAIIHHELDVGWQVLELKLEGIFP